MGTGSSTVEDEYHIQKVKLGEGSFGVVWRAVHRNTGQVVAMKRMSKATMAKQGLWQADVDREIAFMNRLQHDNIVRLYRDFQDAGYVYLALEFCDAGDFGDKIKERGSGMSEQEAAFWVRQILDPIAYLHARKICHRDIKPDNFLVAGRTCTLKLADLGLAAECPGPGSLRDRCGTNGYMAPELCRSLAYGREVDMWAAGICMYMTMLSGRHPFIDMKGALDERRALSGELNFYQVRSWSGFGDRTPRASDSVAAQQLCRGLVEVDARRRVSAEDAIANPWFQQGGIWAQKLGLRSSSSLSSLSSQGAELPRLLGSSGQRGPLSARMKL